MKVTCERDLFHVRLCVDPGKSEEELGFPLQMCLRNPMTYILSCHLQQTDGSCLICWDITSRHSFDEMLSTQGFGRVHLEVLLEGLLGVLGELEAYMIPCTCLVPDPEYIYFDSALKQVCFLLDFDRDNSFRKDLMTLGERILDRIDHRDPEAMALGYGFYRLAARDTFDVEGLKQLLQRTPEKESDLLRGQEEHIQNADAVKTPVYYEEMKRQQETLEALLADSAGEPASQRKPYLLIFLALTLLGIGAEVLIYFRNGRHLQATYIAGGIVLLLLCSLVLLALQFGSAGWSSLMEKVKNRSESREDGRNPSGVFSSACEDHDSLRWDTSVNPPPRTDSQSGNYTGMFSRRSGIQDFEETVIFSQPQEPGGKAALQLEASGEVIALKGTSWVIGKKRGSVDILLESAMVSRLHARIYLDKDEYYLTDMNSRNGSQVNGKVIKYKENCLLQDGDEILLADIRMKFLRG